MNRRENLLNNKENLFSNHNKEEVKRLNVQQELLYNYDTEVYNKYLNKNIEYSVLDLGCNNGVAAYERFKDFNVKSYIGIDIDKESIEVASLRFGDNTYHYFCVDIEDKDFPNRLEEIVNNFNIKFNVINCLALFSHLKDPGSLLKRVKRFCEKDCLIFVRNIDDGLNISYGSKLINKCLRLIESTKFTGFRYSGREVYKILLKLKLKNIKLEKLGINNVGFNKEENLKIVETIFGILRNSLLKEKELNIISSKNLKNLDWLNKNYNKIKKDALKVGFFINLGFMFYVGKI